MNEYDISPVYSSKWWEMPCVLFEREGLFWFVFVWKVFTCLRCWHEYQMIVRSLAKLSRQRMFLFSVEAIQTKFIQSKAILCTAKAHVFMEHANLHLVEWKSTCSQWRSCIVNSAKKTQGKHRIWERKPVNCSVPRNIKGTYSCLHVTFVMNEDLQAGAPPVTSRHLPAARFQRFVGDSGGLSAIYEHRRQRVARKQWGSEAWKLRRWDDPWG